MNLGIGNVRSVQNAFQALGGEVLLTESSEGIRNASHVVIPGVGSFKKGMEILREKGLIDPLRTMKDRRIPILGICLGMQLLAQSGEEFGQSEGLGFIAGEVIGLKISPQERLPHVGWNEIEIRQSSPLLEGISPNTDFYFDHSYHFVCKDISNSLATTLYAGGFCSVVGKQNIFGVQFHPEKSGNAGIRLLKNFLSLRRIQ